MSRGDWTDEENDLIVEDYFAMLKADFSGRPYKKAEHNRRLQARIARSHKSIEYKHQNISAVLKGLGEDWIPGYKPKFHYQMSLEDAVERWLARNPDWHERQPREALGAGLREPGQLWVGPAPTLSNRPPPEELQQTQQIAARFDVAGRDERNRVLGEAGEEYVLAHEKARLTAEGRKDLAGRVRWVSQEEGGGAGYDISSFTSEGQERFIEVKTTNGWERTPFHISRNELCVSRERKEAWCLLRLWNFSREPKAFELWPPLEAHVSLMPTSFLASFE